jgi:hypothetical protein
MRAGFSSLGCDSGDFTLRNQPFATGIYGSNPDISSHVGSGMAAYP